VNNLLRNSLQNAFTNISRNKLINFLSFGIIAFTLFIFGIFSYLTFSLNTFIDSFSKNVEAIFYLENHAARPEVERLIRRLEDNLLVDKVAYHSGQQAEAAFIRQFPELEYILSEFEESPFPASIEVTFKPEENIDVKIISLIEEIEKLGIVESKQVNLDWAQKIISMKNFVSMVGIFLSLILIFVSCFIIFNVIKLNIFSRREEIAIFRLVGAQDWYIGFPFIIEGALLGFLGSVLAGLFLYAALKLFPIYATFMADVVKGMVDFTHIPLSLFVRLLILGTAIGLVSSFLSLRQFLKK